MVKKIMTPSASKLDPFKPRSHDAILSAASTISRENEDSI